MSSLVVSSLGTKGRDIPNPTMPVPPYTSSPWVRPSDWLAMPTVTSSDNKFVGLLLIIPNFTNSISLSMTTSSGTYNVDWGDGTTSTGVTSATQIEHTYDYATISSSTLTSLGYKQVLVTVTPASGGFSRVGLDTRPTIMTNGGLTPAIPWADIVISSSSLTSGPNTPAGGGNLANIKLPYLERVRYLSCSVTATSLFSALFSGGYTGLQSVELPSSGLPSTMAFNSMFNGCSNLRYIPDILNTQLSAASHTNIFNGCINLAYGPKLNTTLATSLSGMFNGCTSLVGIPVYDTSNCTNISQMFFATTSLTTIPLLNTAKVTNFNSLFAGGTANVAGVVTIPQLNTANGTDFGSMFSKATALEYIPQINTANGTNCAAMFGQCSALTGNITINTTKATDINGMFTNCSRVENINLVSTANAITMYNAFNNCYDLKTVTGLDANAVGAIGFYNMFANCQSMNTFPTINNFSRTANTNAMFAGCFSLTSAPDLNLSNVTNMTQMFYNCQQLKSVGNITMPTVATNTSAMFQINYALTSIGSNNTVNCTSSTNISSMFASASALPYCNLVSCSNATSGATAFGSASSMSNIILTGTKVTTAINQCNLNKANLESIFQQLGSNTTTQTITITSNPGVDTANAKTSGTTAGSNVVTMANTVGVITGTLLYGTGMNTGIPATAVSSGGSPASSIKYTNTLVNPLQNGDTIMFTNIGIMTAVALNTPYYVVNRDATYFQISATPGGSPIVFTGSGGSVVISIGGATIVNQVVTVNANANVIINGCAGITNAAAALTARNLNTNYATTKNWTVSG